ncbi:MAG: hypothetical protein ACLRWM_00125 [Streptococcus sp.]
MLPAFPVGTADKRKNGRACKTLPKAAEQAEQRNKCAFCSVALRSALRHNNKKGSDLLIGYKADGAEVYQNGQNGAAITWYHRDVLPGQLFGRVNGVPFVADPFINNKGFVPMFVRKKCANKNGTTSVKWVFEHPTEFVNAIKKRLWLTKSGFIAGSVMLTGLLRPKLRQSLKQNSVRKSVKNVQKTVNCGLYKQTKKLLGTNLASTQRRLEGRTTLLYLLNMLVFPDRITGKE